MAKNCLWLILMHQIPTKEDSFRVKIWRSMQKTGALQLKTSVYILPLSKENREKFRLQVQEINEGQGDAFLCQSEFIQGLENTEIVDKFNLDRGDKFQELAQELRKLQKIVDSKKITESDLMTLEHNLGKLERQVSELVLMDYFVCKSQKPTLKLMGNILEKTKQLRVGKGAKIISMKNKGLYQQKTWVTRAEIGVDRVSSAWLISTFIDKKPKFKFVSEDNYLPSQNEIRFDMFAAEFTHVGDKCTFEVLAESFAINSDAIYKMAQVIHDLDLEDSKFGRPETYGIGLVIDSILASESRDEARLKKAKFFFDDLVFTLNKN